MNVLLAGSQGFIGGHILTDLLTQGNTVLCPSRRIQSRYSEEGNHIKFWCDLVHYHRDCNCLDCDSVNRILNHYKPDIFINAAGNPSVKDNQNIDDLKIILNLINMAEDGGNKPIFIHLSSATVYGGSYTLDKMFGHTEGDQITPISFYGALKASIEHFVYSVTQLGKINGRILRLCAIVGPNAKHGIVPALFNKLQSNDQYLEVLGQEPGSIKPFLYVDDVVSAINKTIDIDTEHCPIYNIVNEDSISCKKVAEIIMKETGIKKEIKWSGFSWKGDELKLNVDNNLAKQVLRWGPLYATSEQAIRRVISEIHNKQLIN